MRFEQTLSDNLRRAYKVVVTSEEISSAFKEIIEKKIKSKQYPGFRFGKAPFDYVAKKEAGIIDNVILDRVYKSWEELKKKEKIIIFDQEEEVEDIDIDAYKKNGKDVSFSVKCEIFPELPEVKFKDILVKEKTFDVTENDIEKSIEKLKSEVWIFKNCQKDYKAQKNDLVKIDCNGKMQGKPFSGGDLENFDLQIGSGKILQGLEDALVGLSQSEKKDIDLTFPDDYHDAKVAGKPVSFSLHVKKVQSAVRPKDEDDLVKKFGHKDKEELKKNIAEAIKQRCKSKIFLEMKDQIEKELCKHEFIVPQKLLQRQMDVLKNKKQDDSDLLDLGNEALRTARLSLIFAQFASQKGISLEKQDIITHLNKSAAISGIPKEYILQMYQNVKDFANSTNLRVMEEKILSAIVSSVKKQGVKSSVDEILDDHASGDKGSDSASIKKEHKDKDIVVKDADESK